MYNTHPHRLAIFVLVVTAPYYLEVTVAVTSNHKKRVYGSVKIPTHNKFKDKPTT